MEKKLLLSAGIFLLTALLSVSGAWEEFDFWILDQRMSHVELEPPKNLVVIGIDAKTLHALNEWPISRNTYARLVDQLVDDDVKQIAFDVDLSDPTTPQADAALADAFKRADGRIILPIFFQKDIGDANDIVVTRPLEKLAQHAWLANVNVSPERDGRIRRASYGVWLDGQFYMSLPAMLAGRANRRDLFFYTNYSIRPDLIPRVSFVDLLDGKIDPTRLAGKDVIIGATAVELGDQFAVPVHGVMPGPVIQAMAYETLASGHVVRRPASWATMIILLGWVAVGALLLGRLRATRLLLVGGAALVLIQATGFFLFEWFSVSLDTASWSFAITLICIGGALLETFEQRLQIQGQKAENEYRRRVATSVMADSPDAIIIADDNGLVEMSNPATARLFGGPEGVVPEGTSLSVLLPADLMRSIEEADSFPQDYILRQSDGTEVCLQYAVTRSQVPSRRLSRGSSPFRDLLTYRFHDVTERYLAEEAVRSAHRLEQEASKAKTEFIANMGHELRTPLNAVIGFSELMTSEIFGPLGDERYRAYATDISNSGKRLLDVVNDILDLSRLDSGKAVVTDEVFEVGPAVEACIRIAHAWEEEHERPLVFSGETGTALRADSSMFKKMVVNLLSNAMKFSDPGSEVSVHVTLAADGGLRLSVTDNGIGIAEEDIERLSVPFFQVDGSLARVKEGTGLGLTIVNGYIALHDGHMEVESAPDEGTTFTLVFPVDRVQLADGEQAQSGHG